MSRCFWGKEESPEKLEIEVPVQKQKKHENGDFVSEIPFHEEKMNRREGKH